MLWLSPSWMTCANGIPALLLPQILTPSPLNLYWGSLRVICQRVVNKFINLSNDIYCRVALIYLDYGCVYTMTQPGGCGIKGSVHLWKPRGDDVDFEAPLIIKLQLSLPASRPDPPSASAAFCRSLFETVSRRSSHWDVIHENTLFSAHRSPQTALFTSPHFETFTLCRAGERPGICSHRCCASCGLDEIICLVCPS